VALQTNDKLKRVSNQLNHSIKFKHSIIMEVTMKNKISLRIALLSAAIAAFSFIPGMAVEAEDASAIAGRRNLLVTDSALQEQPSDEANLASHRRWTTESSLLPEEQPADGAFLAAGKQGGIKTIPFLNTETEEGPAIAGSRRTGLITESA
jgi:hypothetical protein